MAGRIRSIKPELLDDDKTVALSDAAWRLFVSSWLLADDEGNFRAGARYLAAEVWKDTARDADEPLTEVASSGLVALYEVNGQRYANIPSWPKHQRIDNAGKPRMPLPPPEVQALRDRFAADCGDPPQPAEDDGGSRLDHRPPTTDTSMSVKRIWDAFTRQRKAAYPDTRQLKFDQTKRRHVRARIADFGEDRVLAVIAKYFNPTYFWGAHGINTPDKLFRSTEQFEKVENATPYTGPREAGAGAVRDLAARGNWTAAINLPPEGV